MTEQNGDGTGFSREYVEGLRQEAAKWRTQFRELETKQTTNTVALELAKRGINADPSWVQVGEGVSVEMAVEDLVARFPNLVSESGLPQPPTNAPKQDTVPVKPASVGVKPQAPATIQTNVPVEPMKGRSLEEIRKDPTARASLRDRYRSMLKKASNQVDPTDY